MPDEQAAGGQGISLPAFDQLVDDIGNAGLYIDPLCDCLACRGARCERFDGSEIRREPGTAYTLTDRIDLGPVFRREPPVFETALTVPPFITIPVPPPPRPLDPDMPSWLARAGAACGMRTNLKP